MTRLASWLGLMVGLLALWVGVEGTTGGESSGILRIDLMAGGLAFMGFLIRLRGRPQGRYFYVIGALVIITAHLPFYFRGAGVWPHLPLIGLGALTFGFGVLGLVMDGVVARSDTT